MPEQQKRLLPINYTATEYESIRNELIQIAERFYPDTFRDFSEASFGAMMVDAVAYVGDQLSFYLDYNINETFLDTSYQYNNIVRHGNVLGYKHQGPTSTFGIASFYILVPATSTGLGPDTRYIPILRRGSTFTSNNGGGFILTENVDFNNPANQVVVARVNNTSGAPTHYAIKAYGNVISGAQGIQKIKVGDFQRYLRLRLRAANIQEIINVVDEQGNVYYEVQYLSQDIIFKEVSNKNYKSDNVPSILKPMLVSRKFTVEKTRSNTYLQFGSGNPGETDVVADPQAVAMDIFGKDYVTDTTFDPTRLSKSENYGIVPSNTVLYVTYRSVGARSNVASNGLTQVTKANLDFANRTTLSQETIESVRRSLEVSNEEPIIGSTTAPSPSEVKRRIFDTFPTQDRAVTKADYENIAYRMAAKFGSIKRCSVQKDPDSLKRNLNMYIISEDNFGKLIKSNATIKNNLKTWLNHYRMINDTIDILDAYIFNFGINFDVNCSVDSNKYAVVQLCVQHLSHYYRSGFFIGEPIYISEIYNVLSKVKGVTSVNSVKIVAKTGVKYSNTTFDINSHLSPDGGVLNIPKNVVPELKYAKVDIKGQSK